MWLDISTVRAARIAVHRPRKRRVNAPKSPADGWGPLDALGQLFWSIEVLFSWKMSFPNSDKRQGFYMHNTRLGMYRSNLYSLVRWNQLCIWSWTFLRLTMTFIFKLGVRNFTSSCTECHVGLQEIADRHHFMQMAVSSMCLNLVMLLNEGLATKGM